MARLEAMVRAAPEARAIHGAMEGCLYQYDYAIAPLQQSDLIGVESELVCENDREARVHGHRLEHHCCGEQHH